MAEEPTAEPNPTPVAEPKAGLLRLPWWRWPYVLVPAVPLVLLLVAAVALWPEVHARLEVGDYRAAKQHVQEFAWPAELHDDPTFTACGGFVLRCARTELAPEAALRAALPALAAAGLDLGPVQCGAEADAALFWRVLRQLRQSDCTAVARKAGFSVQALATTYPAMGAGSEDLDLGYTQVSLVLSPESERLAALVEETSVTGTRAPLPARAADVPGLPTLLKSLECTHPEGDGCRQFDGVLTMRDADAADLDDVATQLAADLRAGGHVVNIQGCRDTDAGRQCTVSAMAYRSAGANDLTIVVAIMTPDPAGGLTVRASISAR
jgi:hypothetical protein